MTDQAWEDWEEDAAAPAAIASAPHVDADVEAPTDDPLHWTWDVEHLLSEVQTLPAAESCAIVSSSVDPAQNDAPMLRTLLQCAHDAKQDVHAALQRVDVLCALGNVTQWHVLQLRHALLQDARAAEELLQLEAALSAQSGAWGSMTTPRDTDCRHIDEMARVMHRALDACGDQDESAGLEPFHQAFTDLFAGADQQGVRIPARWIRQVDSPVVDRGGSGDGGQRGSSYLDHLLPHVDQATSDGAPMELTESEVFQDAKDIQRDELVVNGTRIAGSGGYDAVVQLIQTEIRSELAGRAGVNALAPHAERAVPQIAQWILHACNRTESGGCSYETLSQLVTNHQTDHVLIRPASAKALPLELAMDLGPFIWDDQQWGFGLRVAVSAITRYALCDAQDPTHEFYQVETNYTTRLAFPLSLTALVPSTRMRHDMGSVAIRVISLARSSDELSDQPVSDE